MSYKSNTKEEQQMALEIVWESGSEDQEIALGQLLGQMTPDGKRNAMIMDAGQPGRRQCDGLESWMSVYSMNDPRAGKCSVLVGVCF